MLKAQGAKLFILILMIVLFATFASPALAGITGMEVVHSDVTFGHSRYTNLDTVLGEIKRDTGSNYVVTPWNCPWETSEITIITEGTLTVKMSDTVFVTDDSMELGIYTAQMYNLQTGAFMNSNMGATISVSKDGDNWVALNGGNPTALNTPSLGYRFPDNDWPDLSQWDGPLDELEETDLYKPFDPSGISDWLDTTAVLEAYGDSAGGNWFDLSGTGLDYIQYVKLDDIYATGSAWTTGLRIDGFVGVSAVPVPAAVWLLGSGLLGLIGIRRRNK